MKIRRLYEENYSRVCWLSFLLVSATRSQAQRNAGTEKAVADLEQQWLKAERTGNVALLEPLLAEGFTDTSSTGIVHNRAEEIADFKATKYTSADYSDLKVKNLRRYAIAVARFRSKGTDSEGQPFDSNEHFTDTWVTMPNGKWQCVASHQSPVKM